MTDQPHILGVDVGGVIIDRQADGTDTSFFSKNYKRTPAVEGAFETLARLAGSFEIHLVSKCGETVEGKTRSWLKTNSFHETTGISPDRLHFCRERKDKAAICATLGVTHFVDDRLEVLSYLGSVPHLFLFRPTEEEVRQFVAFLPRVKRVNAWAEIERALRG